MTIFYTRARYSDYTLKYYFHMEFQNILWEFAAKTGLNFEDFIFQLAVEEEKVSKVQEYKAEQFYCNQERLLLLRKAPKQIKCMVSQLLLDFKKEKVLACPACFYLVKKRYLKRWLTVKSYCPACHEKITINDCLTVKKIKKINREQQKICKKITQITEKERLIFKQSLQHHQ